MVYTMNCYRLAAKYNFPRDYFRLDKNSHEIILKCGVFEKENAATTKQQLEDQHLQASDCKVPNLPGFLFIPNPL